MSHARVVARLLAAVPAGLGLLAGPTAAQQPFPYRLDRPLDVALAASGAGLVAGGFVLQGNLDTLTAPQIAALDPQDVNAFDRGATRQWDPSSSKASDLLVVSLLAAPTALMVAGPGVQEPATLTVMYTETLLLANGLVGVTKGLTKRTRPYVYNDDPDITLERKQSKSARTSFPSGHTANAFASAVFLSTVYARLNPGSSARAWVWAGSLTAATAIGVLRYEAGKHFPTDVLTGAVIGGALGWVVPKLHESDRARLALAPVPGGSAIGLTVSF